ncbi:MAG: RAMP superfamily CRISPR-associated protein [Dethiobacteria bacterium]|jgi:CRISPR/Cas system CSM-associated protein Csm3 (group 7 of RAMP superfamily)
MGGIWWRGKRSRKITKRIVVEGELILQTPACFGKGDTDDLVDMPLLVDPLDGITPLLSGASIAGALRGYLTAREHGYRKEAGADSASTLLFGAQKKDSEEEGEQSPLIIDDALGKSPGIEYRHSVAIDPQSGTARGQQLFDLALWQAGTTFPLRFELVICEKDDEEVLKIALATALEGFNNGGITLGARKSRGFGRLSAPHWRAKVYDLTTAKGLLGWITQGDSPVSAETKGIKETLGVKETLPDKRCFFSLDLTCSLNGSLLVRSGSGKDECSPDMAYLSAKQSDGTTAPVLSGTSAAGTLRARAFKIAKTFSNGTCAAALIGEMFGPEMGQSTEPVASRLVVDETAIKNGETNLVQNRICIDRFTGGALETALFNQQPVFGNDETELNIKIQLQHPKNHEIGLLLLLLKDIWTSDLPFGGERGIGRGRLKGKIAKLKLVNKKDSFSCTLTAGDNSKLVIDQEDHYSTLEKYAADFYKRAKEGAG